MRIRARLTRRIREFFGYVQGNQRKLIDALLESPDGKTDAQLCQHLGLADNRALAGVFAAVYKNAKKAGADPNEVYVRETVNIGDRSQNEYTLAPMFREATRKWRP